MENSTRKPDYSIDPRFVARWSPRAFDARPMTAEQLMPLFEAARWAPSCFNSQPWRFVYALRGSARWPLFLDLLMPNNQVWAKDASALIVMCSKTELTIPGTTNVIPALTHSFDAGAAWMQLALEAVAQGMHAHAMMGFDRERAAKELHVPETCAVETAIAVGWQGDKSKLPDYMQAREQPSPRNPVSSFVFEGQFHAA